MKRFLIDGYNMGLEKGTGVATYGRNLCASVKSLGHSVHVLYAKATKPTAEALLQEVTFFDAATSKTRYRFGRLSRITEVLLTPSRTKVYKTPISGDVIYESLNAQMPVFDEILTSPDLYRRAHSAFQHLNQFTTLRMPDRIDLAHWTYPLPIRLDKAVNIYTLHDLVPLRLPHTTLDNKRRYLKMCRRLAVQADHIVTVSETSKQDIMHILGVPESRVTNTYQAVSIPKKLVEKADDVVAQEIEGLFGFQYRQYFLFFGAIEPKKNVGRLIEAYLSSGSKTPLVIVGAPGWKSREELKLFHAISGLSNDRRSTSRISVLEYLPFPLLVTMIRGARGVLFPSLYEGFGLPVLEAMSLGTPVIASNTSSMPEVAGEAALLVNPYDTSAIGDAIRKMDADHELRIELVRRGLIQVQKFSDEAYCQKLEALYARLL